MVHPLILQRRSTCEKPNTGKLPRRNTDTNCSSSPGRSPKIARVISADPPSPSTPYSYEKGVGSTSWSVVTSSSPDKRSSRKQPNSAVSAREREMSFRVKDESPNGVAFPNKPKTRDPCLSTLHCADVFSIFKLNGINFFSDSSICRPILRSPNVLAKGHQKTTDTETLARLPSGLYPY